MQNQHLQVLVHLKTRICLNHTCSELPEETPAYPNASFQQISPHPKASAKKKILPTTKGPKAL